MSHNVVAVKLCRGDRLLGEDRSLSAAQGFLWLTVPTLSQPLAHPSAAVLATNCPFLERRSQCSAALHSLVPLDLAADGFLMAESHHLSLSELCARLLIYSCSAELPLSCLDPRRDSNALCSSPHFHRFILWSDFIFCRLSSCGSGGTCTAPPW